LKTVFFFFDIKSNKCLSFCSMILNELN